jgi:hypothetical protein
MFVFQSYLIFYFFLYISFLCVSEYLKTMYLLCIYVGPVCPTDFLRTRWRPRPEAGPAIADGPVEGGPPTREAERVLRWVEKNLTVLTRTVPMARD